MGTQSEKHRFASISEQDYKGILNEFPVIVIITDQNGRILFGNPQVEEQLGYLLSDLEESFIWQLYQDEHRDRDFFKALFKRLVTGNVLSFDTQALHKDGERVWLAVKVKLVKREKGPRVILCVASDVTHSRKLESQIIEIAENERLRIGQELHDSVGQMLSGIGLMTQSLIRRMDATRDQEITVLKEIVEMIQETDEMTRKLAHGFSFSLLEPDNEGLQTAIMSLCDRYYSISGVKCSFECSPDLEFRDKALILHLFRIIQESIHNAMKHGDPSIINVRLAYEEQFLKLWIDDNGSGFRSIEQVEDKGGIGIETMKYRAELLGGQLELLNTSNNWTRVACLIPFTKS